MYDHLLDPMLQFRDMLTRPTNTTISLLAPTPTPHNQDEHCPTLTATINDHDIPSVVIDGGSGVNVISEDTCLDLGLKHWQSWLFHLRMTDTSGVRPLGLITKLLVWIGGDFFEISAVVLHLFEQGRYPLLLGWP